MQYDRLSQQQLSFLFYMSVRREAFKDAIKVNMKQAVWTLPVKPEQVNSLASQLKLPLAGGRHCHAHDRLRWWHIIVCGDLNCPGADDSSVDVELADCFESLGLMQLVDEPTRRLPDVANLLDVVATNNSNLVANVRVDDADCLSNHCLSSLSTLPHVLRSPSTHISVETSAQSTLWISRRISGSRSSSLYQLTRSTRVDQLNDVLTELLDKVAPVLFGVGVAVHRNRLASGCRQKLRLSLRSVPAVALNGGGIQLVQRLIGPSTVERVARRISWSTSWGPPRPITVIAYSWYTKSGRP